MPGKTSLVATVWLAATILTAPADAGDHRIRYGRATETTPHATLSALAQLGDAPNVLMQLDRSRGKAAVPFLRRSGAELVAPELMLWRLPREAAIPLVPLLQLGDALRALAPDRPLRRPSTHITSGDPLVASEYWLASIGADRVEPPGPGKPVTIVDTGVDLSHPEFAGRPNTVALNAQRVFGENDDHGTSVASVVAAPANGAGLVGVYPQASLQTWDASLAGLGQLTIADEVRGILAAAARGRGVINLSLGSEEYDRIEENAILTAFRMGSLVVSSSGNEFQEGNPVEYPASLNHVLTVSATDEQDEPAFFSSSSLAVDLAAPGQAIPVAMPLAYEQSGFGVDNGTSFSAPLVSGAAAWIWTARPDLDNTQLFELLRHSARDIAARGYDADTGFGLLDIPRALTARALATDPQEPNDDIDHVRPRGLFRTGTTTLNSATRPRASVRARLDAFEDPDDIYRVTVPPGRAVVVFIVGDRDVDLDLWGPRTRSIFEKGAALKRDLLAASERRGRRQERIRYLNRGRRAVTLYADAFLGKGTRSASYALSVRVVSP